MILILFFRSLDLLEYPIKFSRPVQSIRKVKNPKVAINNSFVVCT